MRRAPRGREVRDRNSTRRVRCALEGRTRNGGSRPGNLALADTPAGLYICSAARRRAARPLDLTSMPQPRPWTRPAGLTGAIVTLLIACSEPSGPDDGPRGVRFVLGEDVTDTIQARPLQALVVEVRDSTGALRPNVIVRFEAQRVAASGTPNDPWNPAGYGAFVSRLEANAFSATLVDTADARGRVSALVQLGVVAGPAAIVAAVPELGLADTARFTVTPGAAARVVALPADTALFAGSSFTMRATVADRFGNARTDAVTYSMGPGTSAGISLAGGVVTAQGVGRYSVIAQAGARADTTGVSVVPEATLAASGAGGIVTFKTDGSAITTLTSTPSRALTTDWSPDGTDILFDEEYVGALRVVNVASRLTRTASTSGAIYGRFSPDGQTLYYSRDGWRLRRQGRDGTNDELVPMTSPSSDVYPGPSPDGTRLAYVTTFGGGNDELKILTLATGASTSLGVAGHSPNWSPAGTQIAFVDARTGEMKLMSADGTNVRLLNPDGRYQRGIDWSPDGRWLVAWNTRTNRIDLIDTQSSLVLPLGFTAGWTAPSWKP